MAQPMLVQAGDHSIGDPKLEVGQPENGNLVEVKASSEGEAPSGNAANRGREGKRRRNRNAGRGRRYRSEGDENTPLTDFAIKVSASSNVKAVAGKVAHSSRTGEPPIVLAIGHTCLNVAVKAVAIARTYVKDKAYNKAEEQAGDGFDLVCQPAFRRSESGRQGRQKGACLALYLFKREGAVNVEDLQDIADLTVSSNSDPSTVAGALAARVREQKNVCLTAIGVDAVAIAIRAVCHARMYLENDNVDILARPQFVQVVKESTTLSAMRLYIAVEAKE